MTGIKLEQNGVWVQGSAGCSCGLSMACSRCSVSTQQRIANAHASMEEAQRQIHVDAIREDVMADRVAARGPFVQEAARLYGPAGQTDRAFTREELLMVLRFELASCGIEAEPRKTLGRLIFAFERV
jgi:hypothetical protein